MFTNNLTPASLLSVDAWLERFKDQAERTLLGTELATALHMHMRALQLRRCLDSLYMFRLRFYNHLSRMADLMIMYTRDAAGRIWIDGPSTDRWENQRVFKGKKFADFMASNPNDPTTLGFLEARKIAEWQYKSERVQEAVGQFAVAY